MACRFLTFNAVIRVNPIEAAPHLNFGADEYELHTPEQVVALRTAFGRGWPQGRMTWGLSWQALSDQRANYVEIRNLLGGYHDNFGDDVTFFAGGGFPNAYSTREQVSRDLHDGLAGAASIVGGSFRPQSVIAGFLAADNLRYLATQEQIHVCQGNSWSYFAAENQDGDGSICYPYFPSREHFCKPAQGPADFIDCVNLNGLTVDFLAARRAGEEGIYTRLGVDPRETLGIHGPALALKQMLATTSTHFDTSVILNGWGWVSTCYDMAVLADPVAGNLEVLTEWLTAVRRRWPDAVCPTQGEFGLQWRREQANNRSTDLRFVQRGTGIGGSDVNLEIRWFMNRDFRLALLRDWQNDGPETVIDFTRYDLAAKEPQQLVRHWTLYGQINQKQTRIQDRPIPLVAFPLGDQRRIFARYPELTMM